MQQQRASKKQQELLSFVDGFIRGNGYGPSYREIMNGLGYKSVSTVAIHIDNLIAKGYLARSDKSARSLEVVSMQPKDISQSAAAQSFEQELAKRIDDAELSAEERVQVDEALKLLGIAQTTALKEAADHA